MALDFGRGSPPFHPVRNGREGCNAGQMPDGAVQYTAAKGAQTEGPH